MIARRDVEQRLHSLGEIREVMNSMKTLAYMEARKLARFLAIQQRQVADIESMAADLLAHFPALRPDSPHSRTGLILIGAERGFCGDFNDRVIRHVSTPPPAAIIAVGHRLVTHLAASDKPVTRLDGANATEQVASVRDALAAAVAALQRAQGPLALTVVCHDGSGPDPHERPLFPPFATLPASTTRHRHAPRLNLAPATLFADLIDQYLFAVLSESLYTSLMAENQKRVQHLDSAIRHLDERREDLARQSRILRQEEIIEEIEVILLNIDHPATPGAAPRQKME